MSAARKTLLIAFTSIASLLLAAALYLFSLDSSQPAHTQFPSLIPILLILFSLRAPPQLNGMVS